MARFYTLKIGTQYITRDGLVSGLPCKLDVPNFDELIFEKTGSVAIGRSGAPFTQVVDTGQKGSIQEIRIQQLTKAVWDQLISELDAVIGTSDKLDLEISGEPGSYTGQCVPLLPKPATPGRFISGQIRDVVIRVITA